MINEDLPRFYQANIPSQGTIDLDSEDSRHAKVLRLNDGDAVHLVDGKGRLYKGVLKMGKRTHQVRIESIVHDESDAPPTPIILALAPTKNTNRLEWAVEKAVESGITQIALLSTARTERSNVRTERLERIAISALKQSKGLFKTEILGHETFDTMMTQAVSHRYIAHCIDSLERAPLTTLLSIPRDEGCLIAIGPEGDFTPEEVALAEKAGFSGLHLGERRLRTETAAMAVSVVAALLRT